MDIAVSREDANRRLRAPIAALVCLGVMACSDDVGDSQASTASSSQPGGALATTASTTSQPGGAQATVVDASGASACALLSVEDVTATGHVVVNGPAPDTAVPGDECVFELTTVEGAVVPGRVTVILFAPAQGQAITPALFPDSVALPGVGTEAWTSVNDRLAGARLADGRVVTVQVAATGPEAPTSALVALLTAAVGRA